MSKKQMRVNIFGAEYALKADNNQDYIAEIAAYVDSKMKEIQKSQTISSNLKLAILAALNIADELFQEKQYRERLIEQINDESKKMNRTLQDALDL